MKIIVFVISAILTAIIGGEIKALVSRLLA